MTRCVASLLLEYVSKTVLTQVVPEHMSGNTKIWISRPTVSCAKCTWWDILSGESKQDSNSPLGQLCWWQQLWVWQKRGAPGFVTLCLQRVLFCSASSPLPRALCRILLHFFTRAACQWRFVATSWRHWWYCAVMLTWWGHTPSPVLLNAIKVKLQISPWSILHVAFFLLLVFSWESSFFLLSLARFLLGFFEIQDNKCFAGSPSFHYHLL